jgi:pilus assembly protein CpaC
MSRFVFSAALTAALLSTTAQVSTQALAEDLPLDSFPLAMTHPSAAHKKKPAAHVPGEGELVPLQMPHEASARSHHRRSPRPGATETDFSSLAAVDRAVAAPAALAAAAAAAQAVPAGERIIRPAGAPAAASSTAPLRATATDRSGSVATTAAPPAPLSVSPTSSSDASSQVAAVSPSELAASTSANVHPLRAGLTAAAAAQTVAASAAAPAAPPASMPSYQTAGLQTGATTAPNGATAGNASISPDLVDALPYGVSLSRPQSGAAQGGGHLPSGMTAAQDQANPPPGRNVITPVRNTLTLEAGLGRVIELASNTASVFAADPKVAEVRPASANSLFVFGVAAGRTTIAALDANGRPVAQYDVVVVPSAYSAGATRGTLAHVLPGHNFHVDQFSNGLQVDGQVNSPADAERVMSVARGFLPTGETASNRLNVNTNMQVNLKVRIAEMSRSVTRDLGLNWSAVGDIGSMAVFTAGSGTLIQGLTQTPGFAQGITKKGGVDAVLEALAQDQLVHSLAEPNLTAMSGETASFLVGGEFPIPVAQQNNTTTIEFKQYGVSLAFVPTVISDGHISLKVRPEVSQLSTQGAITITSTNATLQIPALSVRRAETTVELGSGQSFAIAGLLQDASTISDSAVPFLGEVPILGALFRSDAFLRNETELVIIVTPYIVRPTSNPGALTASTDGNPVPNDYERLVLTHQVGGRPPPARAAGVTAASAPAAGGFVVQ